MPRKAKAAGASAPAVPSPVATVSDPAALISSPPVAFYSTEGKVDRRVRPVSVQIEALEKIIAEAQAQLYALQHPFQEFPKEVKGQVFASRAEQDAAGPEFAD